MSNEMTEELPALAASGEETGDDDTISSFCLSEALNELMEMDESMKDLIGGGSSSPGKKAVAGYVKPVDEILELLVSLNIPRNERMEIIRNLQLRDNWLQYLGKHFQRVLNTIKEDNDERITMLQHVIHRIKLPTDHSKNIAVYSESRSTPRHERSPSTRKDSREDMPTGGTFLEMQAQASEESSYSRRSSVSSSSSSRHRQVIVGKAPHCPARVLPFIKIHSEVVDFDGSPPSKVSKNGGSGLLDTISSSDRRVSNGSDGKPVPGSGNDSLRRAIPASGGASSSARSDGIFSLASSNDDECLCCLVVDAPHQRSRSGGVFCISLVAEQLGNEVLPTSGVLHFSESCQLRAEEMSRRTAA